MSFIEYIKKSIMEYFVIVTGITIASAVLGMNLDPDAVFGYEAFLSPVILGAVAVLPSVVLYSKKELTIKQMLCRRFLHFLALELTLISFGYLSGLFDGLDVVLPFALSVFVVYLFALVFLWIIDSRTAGEINKGLKRIQD